MKHISIFSKFFTNLAIALAATAAFSTAGATTIQLTSGTIEHTYGTGGTYATDYVDIGGYRFETFQGGVLSFNSFSGFGGIHPGGLVDSGPFGVASAMKITRLDGQAFSLDSLVFYDHAFIACGGGYCGIDPDTLIGYPQSGGFPISVGLQYNGDNLTYNTIDVLALNSQFSNVTEVVLNIQESFILDSINLRVVPLPAALPLMISGLGLLGFRMRFRS